MRTGGTLLFALFALAPVTIAAAARADEVELGRAVYTNCAACHGDKGQGGFGPPFAGNPDLKDGPAVIAHVVAGSANMPPFGEQLSSAEIAAVVNHVRNGWGNQAPPVVAADVAAVKRQLAGTRK